MTIKEIISDMISTGDKGKALILIEGKLATEPSIKGLMEARKWRTQILNELIAEAEASRMEGGK